MDRILITSTSFLDTPGRHHELLKELKWDIVEARGPLSEVDTLTVARGIDGYICGDDAITRHVIEQARPRLRAISKYGIGVDKIDVAACTAMGIPVLYTPGVNHTTVAEHVMLLLLAIERHFPFHIDATRAKSWHRKTGREISGKIAGIIGFGRIGKEVALRFKAFGVDVWAYDPYWDDAFASQHGIKHAKTIDEILAASDYVSLNTNLTAETRCLINKQTLAKMKSGVVILNCARGEIVNTFDLVDALDSGHVRGYGADVLDHEPPPINHPLLKRPDCIITPHIASRTLESVQRQAFAAVENLSLTFRGLPPLAQVNPEVTVKG